MAHAFAGGTLSRATFSTHSHGAQSNPSTRVREYNITLYYRPGVEKACAQRVHKAAIFATLPGRTGYFYWKYVS